MSILVYTHSLHDGKALAQFANLPGHPNLLRIADSLKIGPGKDDIGILIMGLHSLPVSLKDIGDLPLAVYLSEADFRSANSKAEIRDALCWAGQRADVLFVENDNLSYRLVGALGMLGRLNKKHDDTKLVQLWPLNAAYEPGDGKSNPLLAWLEHPYRADDANSNWPRLGGDRMAVTTGSHKWFRPKSWIQKIIGRPPSN